MYANYSTPLLSLLVAVILFISLIENILRFKFFGLENQQQSDFIMIEQVFDISKSVLLMPCPFTGPKMFYASPNFLCRIYQKFIHILCQCSDKHFVPEQKMICIL